MNIPIDRSTFYPHGHITIGPFTYARAHHIDSGKPYTVWQPIRSPMWTVLDSQGKNVLVTINKPGQVFTDKDSAEQICKAWND